MNEGSKMTKQKVRELLTECNKRTEAKELTNKELESVAGGVPDSFTFSGTTITPDQLYAYTEDVRQHYGSSVAYEFLESILIEAGYPYAEAAVDAYRVYGSNMWRRLQSLGC